MARGMRNTAVSLSLSPGFPFVCALIHHNACGPSVVPYAYYFQHITPLQGELVSGTWLVRPKDGHPVPRMDVILRVVILEEWQLLRLLTSDSWR
jgi:hypothetical protein